MSLFEVTVRGELDGETYINRWNYVGSGTPAAVSMSFALASAFGAIPAPVTGLLPSDGILATLLSAAVDDLKISGVAVLNLYSVTDFYEVPYPTPQEGNATGSLISPFVTYPLTTNRVRTDIDRGRKLIGGVAEEFVNSGGVIAAGMIALLTDLCALMSDTLTYDDEGNTLSFVPCVVSKQEYTAPSGKRAYRLYSTLAAQMEHVAQGVTWTTKPEISTANSRKRGRGA